MTPEEKILELATTFYRRKGDNSKGLSKMGKLQKKFTLPYGFGPSHKSWRFFERTLAVIEKLGLWKDSMYKTYIEAQFAYSHGYKDENVFPNQLYSENAQQRFQWYLEAKKRRMGKVFEKELSYERKHSVERIKAMFTQGAYRMENYTRNGFTEVETLCLFGHEFIPLFFIACPPAWEKLTNNPDYFGEKVRAVYKVVLGRDAEDLKYLRRLYERELERFRRGWRRGLSI